ncbi:PfkB family carbohydrate kinase [Peptoniphilus equinus]|uniref:PfkB family carbohydrate kinase n=1 Tax=Peptoniphilus equinus TaxID=3016343 RepID=A0ABY7QUC2_9FIRM|nr:PfkB family carbohydrate kinase [Peptoniphilus equinus]WBW49679.1 PfkB family carbohydrate kinase [Peptoniphilus equinus]
MILFCEFNPEVQRVYHVDEFHKHRVNYFSETTLRAGGDTVDVAKLLSGLDDVLVLSFVGGTLGREFTVDLEASHVLYETVTVQAATPERVVIRSNVLKTELTKPMQSLTTEEQESILVAFGEMLDRVDGVILGRENPVLDAVLYRNMLNLCYRKTKPVLVAPERIETVITSKPYLLLVEKEDLESYTGFSIKREQDVVKLANIIFDQGVGVLVVNSDTGVIIATKSESYRVDFDNIAHRGRFRPFGLLSGMALGMDRGYDIIMTLKFAVAFALFDARHDDDLSDLKATMNRIEVRQLGGIV